MNLLFFSDIPWEHLYQRPQQLATRLAQHWPVLWIEPATLGARRKWNPVLCHEGLYALTLPQIPYNARDPRVRAVARILGRLPGFRLLLTTLQFCLFRRAARHLGIGRQTSASAATGSAFAAIVENFQFAPLVERIRPNTVLFDYIDDAFGFASYPEHVHEEWRRTIRMASVLTATSSTLKAQIEQERPALVHLVENGVDAGLYGRDRPHQRPADLPASDRPIIIYVGTVARWFDVALLKEALGAYPRYEFVIVGPVHPDVRQEIFGLRAFPNVRVLDRRPYPSIPAYLRASTVGIIPFLRNRLTEAVNPVKLYEYAAAGLPIVTTAFAGDLERFRDVAFIGRSAREFLASLPAAVAAAQDAGVVSRLRMFAAEQDWSRRSAVLAALLRRECEHNVNYHLKP